MEGSQRLHPAFGHDYYLFRKKVFKIFGGAFHAYDAAGNVIFYSEQKAFKLREDFRIYSDVDKSQELLRISTPQILDIGATYNVFDSTSDQFIGAIRRKFLKSILTDEWVYLAGEGAEIGTLTETSILGALASRVIKLIPQSYDVNSIDGRTIAVLKQHFNPFVLKYTLNIIDPQPPIDRRLLIASGILLAAIEGRQQ